MRRVSVLLTQSVLLGLRCSVSSSSGCQQDSLAPASSAGAAAAWLLSSGPEAKARAELLLTLLWCSHGLDPCVGVGVKDTVGLMWS